MWRIALLCYKKLLLKDIGGHVLANIAPIAPNKAFKAGNAKKGSNLKVSPLMTARAASFEANKVIVF